MAIIFREEEKGGNSEKGRIAWVELFLLTVLLMFWRLKSLLLRELRVTVIEDLNLNFNLPLSLRTNKKYFDVLEI